MKRRRKTDAAYFYAVRINKTLDGSKYPPFLARQHASAPALFWFHKDAVEHKAKCDASPQEEYETEKSKCDIVKVFVRWNLNGKTYNAPGDMFRSAFELKRNADSKPKKGFSSCR